MKLHNILTSLTLAGSLCALTGQAYAAADQGIDFDTAPSVVRVLSPANDPDTLKTVTATCPQNGFLYATASVEIDSNMFVQPSTGLAVIKYSLAKDSVFMDPNTRYQLHFVVPTAAFVAGTPLMRVDSCKANESVTYRFFAGIDTGNTADVLSAFHPTLVVTFFQKRI